MKIMLDTNIILDVLLKRDPFFDDSHKLLQLCEQRKIQGFVSASSITDIFFIVKKYTHSTSLAYKAIGKILEIAKVCNVTNNDVLIAYQKRAKDFEDCLLAICAKSNNCKCLITRNEKDFADLEIPVYSPSAFLERFS